MMVLAKRGENTIVFTADSELEVINVVEATIGTPEQALIMLYNRNAIFRTAVQPNIFGKSLGRLDVMSVVSKKGKRTTKVSRGGPYRMPSTVSIRPVERPEQADPTKTAPQVENPPQETGG